MNKKMVKIGAIALVGVITAGLAGCGGTATSVVEAPTHETETYYTFNFDRFGKDVMPVGAYIGPFGGYGWKGTYIESTVTDAAYATANECGLNFFAAMKQDYNTNPEETMLALDLADRNEIVLYIQDTALYSLGADKRAPLAKADFEARVAAYREHAAFAGLVGRDEPFGFELRACGEVQDRFDEVFPEGSYALYMNSNGYQCPQGWLNGGQTGEVDPTWEGEDLNKEWTYEQYIRNYIEAMDGAKYYSYDVYPFMSEGNLRASYFINLQLVRDLTIEYEIPFWAFIQGGSYYDNQSSWNWSPDEGDMLWNVNTSLAYGAKGIQYFPYAHPAEFNASESGVPSLIGRYGEKTDRWYYAQKANEQIQAIDHVLMNAAHMGMMAYGNSPCPIPENSTLQSFRELKSLSGDASLVGCFDYKGKTALYVVNNSLDKDKAKITLDFDNAYAFEITQAAEKFNLSGKQLTLTLAAGQGALVVLK